MYFEDGQALHASPYATRMEQMAQSLQQLSRAFAGLQEHKSSFSSEEIENMFQELKAKVCTSCNRCSWCWGNDFVHTYQMGYEVLSAVENYGNEINVETERKLQQRCCRSAEFLEQMVEIFRSARRSMLWNNRMAQSREGCAIQIDTFAEMIHSTAKDLEDSIYEDARLKKRMTAQMKRLKIRLIDVIFFISEDGQHKVQMVMRTMRGGAIPMKELARHVSTIMGKHMGLARGQSQVLGREYLTVTFLEQPRYYTMQGIARVGKGCSEVSGDNFMMMELPDGRLGAALSDGMGAGLKACRESTLVIELLEELLAAGFPAKMAVQTINTTLVMGREEIHYSTIDLSVFDLFTGSCEMLKAGASSTFIKYRDHVEHLCSTSLPIGVLNTLNPDSTKRKLRDGDFVIMVTDGVMDTLPAGEQDVILETIIAGTNIHNPQEFARHILEQIMAWSGSPPLDDMSVLAVGMWKC